MPRRRAPRTVHTRPSRTWKCLRSFENYEIDCENVRNLCGYTSDDVAIAFVLAYYQTDTPSNRDATRHRFVLLRLTLWELLFVIPRAALLVCTIHIQTPSALASFHKEPWYQNMNVLPLQLHFDSVCKRSPLWFFTGKLLYVTENNGEFGRNVRRMKYCLGCGGEGREIVEIRWTWRKEPPIYKPAPL